MFADDSLSRTGGASEKRPTAASASRTSAAERRADLLRAIREFAVVKLARRVGSGDRNDLPTVGREEWLVVRASVVREAPLV